MEIKGLADCKDFSYEQLKDLIGKRFFVCGKNRELLGIHIYLSKQGIKSVRAHFQGLNGYIRLKEI